MQKAPLLTRRELLKVGSGLGVGSLLRTQCGNCKHFANSGTRSDTRWRCGGHCDG